MTGLPVPFDTFHRNDQPDAVRLATGDIAPAVVAETDTGIVALLGAAHLEAFEGSVDRLIEAIDEAVAREGLAWPAM